VVVDCDIIYECGELVYVFEVDNGDVVDLG